MLAVSDNRPAADTSGNTGPWSAGGKGPESSAGTGTDGALRVRKRREADRRRAPFGPTSHAYNALIHAYCVAEDSESAEQTRKRMLLHGFLPTPVTYNTLLSLYASWPPTRMREAIEKAEALVHEMQRGGRTALDLYSFCTLIGLYNRAGLPERAAQAFQSMLMLGLKPDRHVYSAMIALYGRHGMPGEAVALYANVKGEGLKPDATILTSMLGVYQKLGRIEDAASIAKEIKGLGQGIDPVVSSAVISFFSKAGRLGDAVRVFEAARKEFGTLRTRAPSLGTPVPSTQLLAQGARAANSSGHGKVDLRGKRRRGGHREPVDAVLLSAMIDAYGKAGEVEKAERLFKELQSLETPGHKNIVAYTTMISLYGKHSRVQQAKDLFLQLKKGSAPVDTLAHNAMLDALAKSKEHQLAADLFQEMLRKGPAPSVYSYSTLIDMHGKDGNLLEASKLFAQMLSRGLRPSVVTYNSLIHMFAQAGMISDANNLYRKLVEGDGDKPNIVTYNIMLTMHADAGNPWDAIRVFRDMERAQCEPDSSMLLLAARMYGKIGQFSRMFTLQNRPTMLTIARIAPPETTTGSEE